MPNINIAYNQYIASELYHNFRITLTHNTKPKTAWRHPNLQGKLGWGKWKSRARPSLAAVANVPFNKAMNLPPATVELHGGWQSQLVVLGSFQVWMCPTVWAGRSWKVTPWTKILIKTMCLLLNDQFINHSAIDHLLSNKMKAKNQIFMRHISSYESIPISILIILS